MSNYDIGYVNCSLCEKCIDACPFDAIAVVDGKIKMNSACKACGICVDSCPEGLITPVKDQRASVDKSQYTDVLVFAEQIEGEVHPVTYELMGKGRELANKIDQELHVILLGHNLMDQTDEILAHGADKIYVYNQKALHHFDV